MEWAGPNRERWVCIWAPVTAATGLGGVHPTWGSVFVAETLAVLFPAAHLLIADHDSAPVSLFEAGQLFRFASRSLSTVSAWQGPLKCLWYGRSCAASAERRSTLALCWFGVRGVPTPSAQVATPSSPIK